MTTLYLRFPDKATFEATLPKGFEQNGETGFPLPEGVEAVRIVGAMFNTVAELPVPVPGFHVNVLGTLPENWQPYQVFPTNPQGVFGEVA